MTDENIHYIDESWNGSNYTAETGTTPNYYDECNWKAVKATDTKSPGTSEDETTLKQP